MKDLTPKQIVAELDKYIVGQDDAKRAVAVAIRNRWRRQQLPEEMRDEVGPKNIIMIGPTGVGKTEIARRLANLVNAPFVKVEASRYTEVGYHGRDVESMVRDLLDLALNTVHQEQTEVVRQEADRRTEERLLDALVPASPLRHDGEADSDMAERRHRSREKFRSDLQAGELDDREIELTVEEKAKPHAVFATVGLDQMDPGLQNMLDQIMPTQARDRRLPIHEARKVIFQQECDKLIDRERAVEMAIRRTENSGMIFLDEIDKICVSDSKQSADISRQGVQRDLLPIVEGTTVMTRHGPVKTDHILFIAAGAFHSSKPNDLMPELQGRFPIRVELDDLSKEDFVRILTEPKNALIKQHIAMLATEGLTLKFKDGAVEAMADLAFQVNRTSQNTGARRLYTISEKLLEDISFNAPERQGDTVTIDEKFVRETLSHITKDEDLSKFIL
ncbi:MAG: ATP-dependent protease ATPase subunit HslU [Planctomycetes bacterium]|nr:ATP-dependent protease ATPase subunit HslU [Planctomycetota bacterium]